MSEIQEYILKASQFIQNYASKLTIHPVLVAFRGWNPLYSVVSSSLPLQISFISTKNIQIPKFHFSSKSYRISENTQLHKRETHENFLSHLHMVCRTTSENMVIEQQSISFKIEESRKGHAQTYKQSRHYL